MHPSERVRIVVETAKAVLDERLEAIHAAEALDLQRDQISQLLRSDRHSVTRSEAEGVANLLRSLGEQVSDAGSDRGDTDAYLRIAGTLGELAQALR